MKILGRNEFLLREFVGELAENECEIKEISVTLRKAPVVEFADGTIVVFDWDELCNMAYEFKKEKSPHACQQ